MANRSAELLREVQDMLQADPPEIPARVTNRLVVAAILEVHSNLRDEIGEVKEMAKENADDIEDLRWSDKRWGTAIGIMAVLGSVISSIIGTNK